MTGSETQEGRKNAGREALDSIWPGGFGSLVPPGKYLPETMNKAVGNMLKHWIAAVFLASSMSSVQRLEGEGSQCRSAGNSGHLALEEGLSFGAHAILPGLQ